jgi:quinoprotein dehydrogenase-associated probable ABC transporter substrate-binding protein
MSSRFLERAFALAVLAAAFALIFGSPDVGAAEPLRVCADPDNLPYSRRDGSGFENRIAELLAADLHRELSYSWQTLGRGLVRKTLGSGECDLLLGVPASLERVAASAPYYRSGYVLVTRADDARPLTGFDDARLKDLRIGVQLVGDDLAATPPGHALARRGALEHVVGFTAGGDGPAAGRMIAALSRGDLDAAMVWGPQAGWFAARAAVPMRVRPLAPPPELAAVPFDYAIALGVRRDASGLSLRRELDEALSRRRAEIDAVLARYDVPLWPLSEAAR